MRALAETSADYKELYEAAKKDAEEAEAYAAKLEAELFELKNAPISFLLDHGKGE